MRIGEINTQGRVRGRRCTSEGGKHTRKVGGGRRKCESKGKDAHLRGGEGRTQVRKE